MSQVSLTPAKRRLLAVLKTEGRCRAADLARELSMTDVAIRQHLTVLEEDGWVFHEVRPPTSRGRPSSWFGLTEKARVLFPDRHGDLTVGLISAVRKAVGEEGLSRVISTRVRDQVREYRKKMPEGASLERRVRTLAAIRSEEGYMAEVRKDGTEGWILLEHHCPICDAASSCVGLCDAELDVFRKTLGKGVRVKRVLHLLSDDDRCAYRIEPTGGSGGRPDGRARS